MNKKEIQKAIAIAGSSGFKGVRAGFGKVEGAIPDGGVPANFHECEDKPTPSERAECWHEKRSNLTPQLAIHSGNPEMINWIQSLREIAKDRAEYWERKKNKAQISEIAVVKREDVLKRWRELIGEGYSDNKAAQIIHEEIGGKKSISAIKRWAHPEYNY